MSFSLKKTLIFIYIFSLNDLDLAKNALEFYLTNTRSTKQDKLLAVRQIISALERFCGTLQSKASTDEVKLLSPVDIQRDVRIHNNMLIKHALDGNKF